MQTTLDSFYRKRSRLPADSESDFSPKRTARKLFETAESSPTSSAGRKAKALRRNAASTCKEHSTKSTPTVSVQSSTADVILSASSTLSHIEPREDKTSLANKPDQETSSIQFDDGSSASTSSISKVSLPLRTDACEPPSTADTSRLNARETENSEKFDDNISEDQNPCSSAPQSSVALDTTHTFKTRGKNHEETAPSSSADPINASDEGPSVRAPEPTTPTRSPSTQTQLKKELNLGEYKKIIKRSKLREPFRGKIQQFEETLASLKETQQSLNDLERSPQLKRFDLMQVEITSPVKRGLLKPRRLFGAGSTFSPTKDSSCLSPTKRSSLTGKSPQKSPNDRLYYLLDEGREPLALPRKYSVLKDTFYWMDTVCKCRQRTTQEIAFNKIREDVQKASGRPFTENDVAKIKSVYPEAFELSRKKLSVPPSKVAKYQLVITMPLSMDLIARERTFQSRLLEKAKFHHQEFLKTLDPPLEIPNTDVKRWHMDFDVDNVPDIEPAPLPVAPSDKSVSYTAKEILEKMRKTTSMSKRMESALKTMAKDDCEEKKTESKPETEVAAETVPAEVHAFEKALKGIAPSLLAKIRAKQAAKLAEDVTRSPVEIEETRKLLRLPELAKILRLVFVTRGKSVLPEDTVVETVMKSFKEKLSRQNLIEHFQLITKYVPGWMNTFVMNNNRYVRLSKDADMSRVTGKLATIAKSV